MFLKRKKGKKITLPDPYIININILKKNQLYFDMINKLPLKKIKWLEDGKILKITKKSIEDFEFIGLNNVEFILSNFYEKENNEET